MSQDSEEIQQILFSSSNPFSSIVVHSAWDEIADVPSINKNPFDDILRVIHKVQQDPNRKAEMILLLGEVGLGKTHLLSRLRMKANPENFYYIQIEPVPDIEKINMHILREIMGNLMRMEKGEGYTFLDQMLVTLFAKKVCTIYERSGRDPAIVNQLNKDPMSLIDLNIPEEEFEMLQNGVLRQLMMEHPGGDVNFLQILFKLVNPHSRHYFKALKWLQCETLPEAELTALGVGESLSDEMRASGALKSILQISDRVIVFGFDQIEGVFQRFGLDGLKTFLQTLAVIYNGIPNHISLISCQSQIWVDFVMKNLDKSVTDRISIKTDLENLAEQDVLDLVELRLKRIWGPQEIIPPDPIYPFSKDFVLDIAAKSGWNPRNILLRLKDQFHEIQSEQIISLEPPPISEEVPEVTLDDLRTFLIGKFEEINDEHYTRYIGFLDAKQEDMMKAVFYQLLDGFKKSKSPPIQVKHITMNFKPVKTQKPIDLVINVHHTPKPVKIGCSFNFSPSMTSVYHALRRLNNGRDKGFFQYTIPFRGRIPISSTASKTQVELNNVLTSGLLITIDNAEGSKLYAIKKLLDSVSAQEIIFGDHPVSYEEAIDIVVDSIITRLGPFQELLEFIQQEIGPPPIIDSKPEPTRVEQIEQITLPNLTESVQMIVQQAKIIPLEELLSKLGLQPSQSQVLLTDVLEKMEVQGQISLERDETTVLIVAEGLFDDGWR